MWSEKIYNISRDILLEEFFSLVRIHSNGTKDYIGYFLKNEFPSSVAPILLTDS